MSERSEWIVERSGASDKGKLCSVAYMTLDVR